MGDIGAVITPAAAIVDPASLPISQSINVLVTGFGVCRSFSLLGFTLLSFCLFGMLD